MNYYDQKEATYACPACGWTGRGDACEMGDGFDWGYEILCARCQQKLGYIGYPTTEEMLSDPRASDGDREQARSRIAREAEFERKMLKDPDQLPVIEPAPASLAWDFEEAEDGKRYVVIRHEAREVWRELAWYEDCERYAAVAEILQRKYGDGLRDLVPTPASKDYLYGDRIASLRRVEEVRSALGRGAYARGA